MGVGDRRDRGKVALMVIQQSVSVAGSINPPMASVPLEWPCRSLFNPPSWTPEFLHSGQVSKQIVGSDQISEDERFPGFIPDFDIRF